MSDQSQPVFRALADPTRRAILRLLSTGDMTIAQVADQFDMTRPAVKKHLALLQEAALITVEPRGRERINRINPTGLTPILSWFEQFDHFWDSRLAALKSAIEKDTR